MNNLRKLDRTEAAQVAVTADATKTGFRVCDDLHDRYRSFLRSDPAVAETIRAMLQHCEGHYNGCPKSDVCSGWTAEFRAETEINLLQSGVGEQAFSGSQIGGENFSAGAGRIIECKDIDGNHVVNQALDLEILHRYEVPFALELLEMWEARKKPNASDFDAARLQQCGISNWMHTLTYDNDVVSRFERFAPGMIRFAGRDLTGESILASGAPAYSEALHRLTVELQGRPGPSYSRVVRTLKPIGAQTNAAMRRLELPLYENRKHSGSLVLIIPE